MSAITSFVNQDGMRIYKNPNTVDIPKVDLPTLLFGACACLDSTPVQLTDHQTDSEHSLAEDDTPLHLSAANPNIYLTKATLRVLTERIAYFLRKSLSVGSQGPYKDVVVVCSSGQPAAAAMFWGIIAAGGVFSAASPSYTPEELARQIRQGKSKVLVVSADKIDVGKKAAQLAGLSMDQVVVLESEPHWKVHCLEGNGQVDVDNGPRLPWRKVTDEDELKKSLIVLLYSSGTTGVPKGRQFPNSHAAVQLTSPRCHAIPLQPSSPTLHPLCSSPLVRRLSHRTRRARPLTLQNPRPPPHRTHCRRIRVPHLSNVLWRLGILDAQVQLDTIPRVLQEAANHRLLHSAEYISSYRKEP